MRLLQTNKLALWSALLLTVPSVLAAVHFQAAWLAVVPFLVLLGFIAWQQPSIILSWLLISIPFSIEYSFSDRLGTDLPDEPLMVILTLLAVLHLAFRGRIFSSSYISHPLFVCFLLWLSWMTVASLFSTTPDLSLKFLLAKSWYVGAFFLAPLIWLRTKDQIGRSLQYLYLPLFILACITLLRHTYHQFSFIRANEVVQPYFRNHVVYSAMLVTLLPVLYFSRPFSDRKRLWWIVLLITVVALFFSYARGAWLALLVGAVSYLLLRKRMLLYGYVVALSLGVLAIIWLKQDDRYLRYAPDYRTTIFHSDFSDHWRATYAGKDVSTVERFYRWIAGVRMVERKPWTGFGPSSFYSSYRPFAVPAYKTWVSDNSDRSTVHNYFLLTAAEQGIPGLIIFLFLFGALLYYAERIYHAHKEDWARQLSGGIAIVLVMLGVVNFWSDLIETDKIGSLFFLSIALLLILDRSGSSRSHIQGVS